MLLVIIPNFSSFLFVSSLYCVRQFRQFVCGYCRFSLNIRIIRRSTRLDSQKSPSEPIEDRSDTEFFINNVFFFCECRSGFQPSRPACCTTTPMALLLCCILFSRYFFVLSLARLFAFAFYALQVQALFVCGISSNRKIRNKNWQSVFSLYFK